MIEVDTRYSETHGRVGLPTVGAVSKDILETGLHLILERLGRFNKRGEDTFQAEGETYKNLGV